MKITLLSLLVAALLGLAAVASGRLFDAADFVAIAFTTGLFAWTVAQYSAGPRALTMGRRIHLPIEIETSCVARQSVRRVA